MGCMVTYGLNRHDRLVEKQCMVIGRYGHFRILEKRVV